MSRTLGRVQRGGSPFAGGGGHTLGHTLCVSTPHPAYDFLGGLRQRQGSLKVPLIFSRKRQGMRIPLHSVMGIAYPTVRHWGCTPLDTPQNTKGFYGFLLSVWEYDFFEIFSVLFVVFCVIGLMEK